MADEVRVEVGYVGDRASAEKAADPLEDALTNAMSAAIKVFIAEFRKGVQTVGKAFASDPGLRRFQVGLDGIVEELNHAAVASSKFADTFSADLRSLEARARATQAAIAKTGNDSGIGASIETQLRKTLELQRDLEKNAVELARNPQLVRAYENRAEIIRTGLAQDVRFVNKILEQGTQKEIAELNQRNAAAAAASRERITAANAARSANVVAQQREGALELEAARGANRQRLQDDRATARQRLAIFQAVSQQIRALERGISATLRGAGSLLGGVATGLSSSVGRITSIFRRSNADLNQGLQPALERRAGLFRRSNAEITQGLEPALERRTSIFRRELSQTESVIRSSTIRQSALLQRAEAQASTGIAGVVSGRSQIGSLLGGGLAIGGGFTLITKLRQGFQESVNLNESLNKTQQIFGDATEAILEFADTSVEALFVTKSAALEAAANFGIFGKSAGLAGPELANFSKTLTTLATDLASFNNTSIEDATTAVAAALRGESEPIRRYGVLLNEAVLQQRAFSEGITDSIRKLTPQERVLAANAEILAQTAVQQGDAARTADDFANSSRRAAAASIEFFASIAKFAVPLATVLTNVLLPVFVKLTDFVNGDVGPALGTLRDGLIGAGAALGGLLAAKAAGEALQFLSVGLRAVLTPMGLLITAVGIFGAAVNILAKRSPELRRAFDDIRESIGNRFRQGLELAQDVLRRLGEVIVNTILPAAIDLAFAVRDRLVSAFDATVGFVQGRVIPAFERFGRFLRDVVAPAIVDIAREVRERLGPVFSRVREFVQPAIEALGRFFTAARNALRLAELGNFSGVLESLQSVRGFIQPVTDAFRDLGLVIAGLFTEDLDGVLDRLREFGVQGAAIAGIASAAIAAAFVNPLLGIGVAITGGLALAFGDDLLDAIQPQLERVREFLRGLFDIDFGNVATTFLKVVRRIGEIIGGIVTDRRFVTAVAAIGGAAVVTGGAFVLGFAQGVRDNIPELINLLGDALKLAFREAFKFALSSPEVILGVLAGGAVLGAIKRAFTAAGTAGATSFGSSFLTGTRAFFQRNAFAAGFFGGAEGLQAAATKQATAEAKALQKARANAARDLALLNQPSPFVVGSGGAGTTTKDDIAALDAVKRKFGDAQVAGALFRAETSKTFQSLGVAAGGLGQAISGNVRGGLQQASAGFSGFATGVRGVFTRLKTDLKAAAGGLGQALGGAIASGIGAALSGQALGTSDSAVGRGLGLAGIISSSLFASAATGGNVGVGLAVGAVGLVTAALASNETAARDAKTRIAEYTSALRDLKTPAEQAAFVLETITRGLEGLPASALTLLDQANIDVASFAQGIADGTVNIDDLEARLRQLPAATQAGFEDFRTPPLTKAAKEAIEFVTKSAEELAAAKAAQPLLDRVVGSPRSIFQFGEDARDAVSKVQAVQGAVSALGEAIRVDLPDGRIEGQRWQQGLVGEGVKFRIEATKSAIEGVGDAIDVLNQKRTDQINAEIDSTSDALAGAQEAAGLARDAVASFFTGGFLESASGQLDQLITQIPGIGQQLGDALATGGEVGAAGARITLASFADEAGAILSRAFTDNPLLTTADALAQLDPVFRAIRQAADADAGAIAEARANALAEGLSPEQIDKAGLDAADLFTPQAAEDLINSIKKPLEEGDFQATVDFSKAANEEVARLQRVLDEQRVELNADIVFSRGQLIKALSDVLDLSATEAAAVLARADFQKVFETGFDEQGIALTAVDGIVAAFEDGETRVNEAVRHMASQAELALADQLDAHSPSRVFKALGQTIPEGIVAGILEGAPAATVALRELSSDLFNRLSSTPGTLADNFRNVLQEFTVEIPDAMAPATESVRDFVGEVFDAIAALEDLAGVDLSMLEVGTPDSQNPLSNAGRTATQFANDLRTRLQGTQPHPAGWVQTEDGTWVPPSFFAPPPTLGQSTSSVDMREGAVTQPPVGGEIRIDGITINETSNARATARETILALRTAPLIASAVAIRNRVADDVNAV
jgi:hypothetical protein